jgi:hypothetical protein
MSKNNKGKTSFVASEQAPGVDETLQANQADASDEGTEETVVADGVEENGNVTSEEQAVDLNKDSEEPAADEGQAGAPSVEGDESIDPATGENLGAAAESNEGNDQLEEEVIVDVSTPAIDEAGPAVTFAVPEVPELTPVVGTMPAVTQFFYDLVDSYVDKMRPGVRVSEAEGRQYQRGLLRIYQQVLARDGEEFVTAMNALLARFNDHRGLTFGEEYVFRFLGAAGFEANQSKLFQTFTTLCMRICDPQSRALRISQDINQAAVLDKLLNEEQRQRLQGYLQSYL